MWHGFTRRRSARPGVGLAFLLLLMALALSNVVGPDMRGWSVGAPRPEGHLDLWWRPLVSVAIALLER